MRGHIFWTLPLIGLLFGCDSGSKATETERATPTKSAEAKPAGPADAEAEKRCGEKKGDELVGCLVELADGRLAEGKDQEAVNAFARAVHGAPDKLKPWARLADAFDAVGDERAAAKVLEQAKCHVKAKVYAVHVMLAELHIRDGRMAEAVTELEAARAAAPNEPAVVFNLGMAYARLTPPKKGESVAALQAFTQAACGTNEASYRAECAQSAMVLEKLEGTEPASTKPDVAPPPQCGEGVELPKLEVKTSKVKEGDAYTVWGASHHLRTDPLRETVTAKPVTIVGHVVATNYGEVPACALHEVGKETPADCSPPYPKILIADSAGEKKARIAVMGWASNWSQLLALMQLIDAGSPEANDYLDFFTGTKIPIPIPNVGAKVRVTGKYGVIGPRGASDPRYGIITATQIETLSAAPTKAALPGHDRKE